MIALGLVFIGVMAMIGYVCYNDYKINNENKGE